MLITVLKSIPDQFKGDDLNEFKLGIFFSFSKCSVDFSYINPYPAEHDNPYLCKQCRSRSDGFFRSHLIRIYTVCHAVWELNEYIISSNLISG